MNILVFIIVLGILIFVHELGHFSFAKLFKIRVDEFGFGYPPRIAKIGKWKETVLTINWIPFGGFVKIFGEADDGRELNEQEKKESLIYKPRWQQFLVMFAGVLFNFLFAWLLFSALYFSGVTASLSSVPESYKVHDTRVVVSSISEGSPAFEAGLQAGDEIKELFSQDFQIPITVENIDENIRFFNEQGEKGENAGLVVLRNGELTIVEVQPVEDIIPGKYGIGIAIDKVGKLDLNIIQAASLGFKNTLFMTKEIALSFWHLITGSISFDNVSGPVGIVKQIGQASSIGFSYLISFTALLSINLAILNLIPFPALDGGRILIILIESIIRKRIKPVITNWINVVGFFVLILLMVVVTIKDVIGLF